VQYWYLLKSRHRWKLAADPLESARKYVETEGRKEHVRLMDIEAVPGASVLAFEVQDILMELQRQVREIGVDSTCA
jgi:hypothetical protein